MARKRDPLSQEELLRFEGSVGEIFSRLGMDLSSPGCRDTPKRWLRALIEMTDGYNGDGKIRTVFPRECVGCESGVGEQTVEGPIDFVSLCEHHALPFIGKAWIGYLRNETIIGISKFTRIVHMYARRFSLQERMAQEIANELESILKPYGVIVYLQAHHSCTQARGVREAGALTRTLEKRSAYQDQPHLVSEFMDLAGLPRPHA
jgi:GTP cyclohydrolase I